MSERVNFQTQSAYGNLSIKRKPPISQEQPILQEQQESNDDIGKLLNFIYDKLVNVNNYYYKNIEDLIDQDNINDLILSNNDFDFIIETWNSSKYYIIKEDESFSNMAKRYIDNKSILYVYITLDRKRLDASAMGNNVFIFDLDYRSGGLEEQLDLLNTEISKSTSIIFNNNIRGNDTLYNTDPIAFVIMLMGISSIIDNSPYGLVRLYNSIGNFPISFDDMKYIYKSKDKYKIHKEFMETGKDKIDINTIKQFKKILEKIEEEEKAREAEATGGNITDEDKTIYLDELLKKLKKYDKVIEQLNKDYDDTKAALLASDKIIIEGYLTELSNIYKSVYNDSTNIGEPDSIYQRIQQHNIPKEDIDGIKKSLTDLDNTLKLKGIDLTTKKLTDLKKTIYYKKTDASFEIIDGVRNIITKKTKELKSVYKNKLDILKKKINGYSLSAPNV